MAYWSDPTGASPAHLSDLGVVFTNLLNVVVGLAGVILFIMLIVGGLGYLTSGGDPEKVKKASGTLTWAVLGLVFLIGGWFILRFIHEFTGVDVTKIQFPGS